MTVTATIAAADTEHESDTVQSFVVHNVETARGIQNSTNTTAQTWHKQLGLVALSADHQAWHDMQVIALRHKRAWLTYDHCNPHSSSPSVHICQAVLQCIKPAES